MHRYTFTLKINDYGKDANICLNTPSDGIFEQQPIEMTPVML
jgi:hypothetical protein